MMELTQGLGRKQPTVINTKHILFVVSGAFDNLDKIVRKRLRETTIGFAATAQVAPNEDQSLQLAHTRDFIDYGFEPEFIGRLPIRVVCQPLTVDDLFLILKSSEGSIVRQYEQSFGAYGIEVLFHDDGLKRIAELAADEKTGARGLMTVCERVFRDLKFELPSTHVQRFVVDRNLVDQPQAELQRLLAQQQIEEQVISRQVVHEFGRRFEETHNLKLTFTEAAADRLVVLAQEQAKTVRDVCAERFKDFQFGLKLVAKNTGQHEFTVDVETVDNPDQALSNWVVASYRAESSAPASAS
jgi:ATP-dependent protease HslVU (ClpYQ) ATPase subunit